MNYKKNWTILIYADGNNEMEEVMYNAFLQLNKINQCENINVIIEMGLLGSNPSASLDKWSGVRRYSIDSTHSNNSLVPFSSKAIYEPISCNRENLINPVHLDFSTNLKLIQDLGKQNMADPNNLYSFIAWGMRTYPAEHYMVIISGHGTDFVGGLTDLSGDKNYIMGIPEIFKAIFLGSSNATSVIDILVLDMCFMNSIETLYEVSQYDNNIKVLINYTNFAPYEGLNYSHLINIINKGYRAQSTDLLVKNLIETLPYDLTAYKIDNTLFEKIKRNFNSLAFDYLNKVIKSNPLNLLDIYKLQPNSNSLRDRNILEEGFINYIESINKNLESAIIFTKNKFLGLNTSINITHSEIGRLIGFYNKLAFSRNNCWTKLLSNITSYEVDTTKVMVRTLDSSPSSVHYILELNS